VSAPLEMRLRIVTGLADDRQAVLNEVTIDQLLTVLFRRANRLVDDARVGDRLRPVLRDFVHNVITYFNDSGQLDEYVMTNIMTALVTADSHGPSDHGVEDYSTFIRSLNPTDPDAGRYFLIGRAGSVNDPACPLNEMAQDSGWLSRTPAAQLHMFHAFHYARSRDTSRGAPRIPVEDLRLLVPSEITGDSELEEAFLDVCFSDGAWQLYHLRLAA
jgi:hypothetical protein